MTLSSEDRAILEAFAEKHELEFNEQGEVGFGRPCVGFTRAESYVAFNPYNDGYEHVLNFYDERLSPPADVDDAYHKHDCLCVLVHDDNYDEALRQLVLWVKHLESVGVEVAKYQSSSHSIKAFLTGDRTSYALRVLTPGVE